MVREKQKKEGERRGKEKSEGDGGQEGPVAV